MAGGVLQLVTKGVENVFLNDDPQITFFKTIYRRHTNFSRTEYDINFTNSLNFGSESICHIKKYGDFLHRLYLVLTLPQIDLVYRTLLIRDVITLFAEINFDIVLTIDFFAAGGIIGLTGSVDLTPEELDFLQKTFHNPNNIYDEAVNTVFIKFINGFVAIFANTLSQVNEVLRLLQPGEYMYYQTFFDTTGLDNSAANEYMDYIILKMFEIDTTFELIYKFIEAQSKDKIPARRLANANDVKLLLFEKIADYVTGATGGNFDPNSFNDENLFFLYVVDSSTYNIGINGQNADSVFRAGVSATYGNVIFTNLDAYKIFNETLIHSNAMLNNNFDVDVIKQELLTAIRIGLVKNIKLLRNIYNSLEDDARFMFYRTFQFDDFGFYNTNSQFQNVSLFTTNDPTLSDRFTTDFNLPPEPNEPSDFYHPFSSFTKNAVNDYHVKNTNRFRTLLLNDYFNSVDLWNRTNVYDAGFCIEAITGSPNGIIPDDFYNIYLLNYIPFLETIDIPKALEKYLIRLRDTAQQEGNIVTSTNIQNIINAIVPKLEDMKNIIMDEITPKICIPDDFVVSKRMSQFRSSIDDIIMTAIIRQHEFIQLDGFNYLLPEYIITQYRKVINDLSSQNLSGYQDVRFDLLDIVGLFNTPLEQIPPFAQYSAQEFNQRSDLIINDNTEIFSDVQSSIWAFLFRSVTSNYNNLYNNTLLSSDFYTNKIGSEMLSYLRAITTDILDLNPDSIINYYYESVLNNFQNKIPINGGQIGTYLNKKLSVFQAQLQHYDRNRKVLNMRDILLPQPEFLFAQFKVILDEFVFGHIEVDRDSQGNLVYDHQYHGTPQDPVIQIYNSMIDPTNPNYDPNEPHLGAMDIMDELQVLFELLITSTTNPFNPITDPNKFGLWNEFWIPFKKFDEDFERAKYDFLFGTTVPEDFYVRLDLINSRYGGFAFEDDEYQLLKDVITDLSLAQGVILLTKNTVIETYEAVLEEFKLRQEDLSFVVNHIDNSIITKLENSLQAGQQAKFAWIRKIGHYIIDEINVKIGDQVIDRQFGEWLEIWHQLTKKDSKERGYKILIGDVPELTTYNADGKESYEIIVPLQFWFNRNIGASLPLIALNHTFVDIGVKLKKLEEVSFFEDLTVFKKKPQLKCKLLAEYIYVEAEERDRIVSAKNEYLIETIQFNDVITINKNTFDDKGNINARMYFKNTVKELFWILQNESFIDGSASNGERKYYNYSTDFETGGEAGIKKNIAKMAKIKFNSRDREVFKDVEYYNYIQPLEHHYSTPDTGIMIYSFSLNPENTQPSGSANMGRIDDSSIEIQLTDSVKTDILEKNARYTWRIYASSYNILRIMSGLAGIVYYR